MTDVRKSVSIRTVVSHIFESTKEAFKGTKFEDSWYMYHDALSLMSSKATVDWMIDMDHYKIWVLPLHDLNVNTRYHGRPVDITTELMPLDCSLFNDLRLGLYYHVMYTSLMIKGDVKKFSFDAVSQGEYAIRSL